MTYGFDISSVPTFSRETVVIDDLPKQIVILSGLDLNFERRLYSFGVSPLVAMHEGKLVFAQVMAHLPLSTFRRCVARYDGDHKVKSSRVSTSSLHGLRSVDLSRVLARHRSLPAHAGSASCTTWAFAARFRATRWPTPTRATWQIYADFAQHLIGIARPLYASEPVRCRSG